MGLIGRRTGSEVYLIGNKGRRGKHVKNKLYAYGLSDTEKHTVQLVHWSILFHFVQQDCPCGYYTNHRVSNTFSKQRKGKKYRNYVCNLCHAINIY